MGVLNQILEDVPRAVAVVVGKPQPAVVNAQVDVAPEEPAIPCLECWSPEFWRLRYGGPLRCSVCEPWPSRSLIGERWAIVKRADGSLVWTPSLRRGERAADRPPVDAADLPPGWTMREMHDDEGDWIVFEKQGA